MGFKPKQLFVIACVSALVAAGVVWSSNNVDAVENALD